MEWDDFLNKAVNATTKIIQSVKSPTGVAAGVPVPLATIPAAGSLPINSQSAAPFLVLLALAYFVMKG